MTNSQLEVMLAESGLDHDGANELAAVLSPLVALGDDAAPTPSGELMHLFDGDAPDGTVHEVRRTLPQSRRGHRTRGTLAGVVVLALSGVGATGLSAAANTLPGSWQHEVADFSHQYLPFDFPEPSARSRRPSDRVPDVARARQGDTDVLDERRDEPAESSRSATRDGFTGKGAPSWHGPGGARPGAGGAGSTGYSVPPAPRTEHATPAAPDDAQSSAGAGPLEGGHDGRGPSRSPDSEEQGTGETRKKNDSSVDYSEISDRPVEGGGVGGPKDVPKAPQNGPQKSPQQGKPAGGADQDEPGNGDPGDGTGTDAGSPGGPEEAPPPSQAGDQGSTGPVGEPGCRDVPPGPVGELLPGA